MSLSGHLELFSADAENLRRPIGEMTPDTANLSSRGAELARKLIWVPDPQADPTFGEHPFGEHPFGDRCRRLVSDIRPLLAAAASRPEEDEPENLRLLHYNLLTLRAELADACESSNRPQKHPYVRTLSGAVIPRIAAVAEGYFAETGYQFNVESFTEYLQAFQDAMVLNMAELWALIPVLKMVLLEQIAERGKCLLEGSGGSPDLQGPVLSVREIRQTTWKAVIEPLIRFDRILREDPAGAYPRMDYETRELYRQKLVNISDHSDCSEMEVAEEVLRLARAAQKQPSTDSRVTLRRSHVGTYLLEEGARQLEQRVDFRAPFAQRMRVFLRSHPDEFYLPGIAVLTLTIVLGVVLILTDPSTPLGLVLLSTLVVLLPSSQSAVQIMNYLATLLLPAQILPKLDFSEGLPADCVTMVAIPTLLLNEKHVRHLVDDLEVRFLGNHDPNLHFLLLTDLPDATEKPAEQNSLVDLCADLIRRLNAKYLGKEMGSFFLLHRHPVYNPRERLWMGWERKRGKLMDLNNLLRGQFDSFPVKVGDLSILSSVRYVITLDSDTELPRGSARRMVGTLAHPLNQAILDPERGVVVTGYGILQPRVGVSVQSSAASRLATIYSGQTGLDIYTRAASDVYQDLYGEGIFVGKGIYEVETLHRVLDRRFPRNALLSHDLVEGAYARAGLVSDIQVIEDYPSHYSAHNRRKHRWLRGDWQIAEWLRPLVPEESGHKVPNPLSVVSRWKILDNLRRSMVEPALFLLLLLGWLCLPGGPGHWTLATIIILLLPAVCQLGFGFVNAAAQRKVAVAFDAVNGFLNESVTVWLMVTFLAHQMLLSMDAMVRTLVRRMITRQRLLQWETAAQAELAGYKRTVLDIYLSWTPALALGIFFLLWFGRRSAVLAALPILLLWACSKPISLWLNRPPRSPRKQESERDRWLLRRASLQTWRYFSEFSTEEHHWLIPDNLQEEEDKSLKVAPRISPTNLGLLLNARQVACESGYLTLPEFAQQTLRTLTTVSQLQRVRGHLLNWYDTQTLAPLTPKFVSSVDSGNLVASLWTLQQGCVELLDRPLLQPELRDGFLAHLYLLATERALPRRKFAAMQRELKQEDWLQYLLDVPDADLKAIHEPSPSPKHANLRWFQEQTEERIRQVGRVVQLYAPWLLPEFTALKDDPVMKSQGRDEGLSMLERMPAFIDKLSFRLKAAADATEPGKPRGLYLQLQSLLPDARAHVSRLVEDLKNIAQQAGTLADEMGFEFLLNQNRGLLSIGFDVEKQEVHSACYDLLASESRIALFVAIAKDDVPQESWFQLGRAQAIDQGVAGLLSWTGTMFEYLMPAIWMRIYPNTLLERAVDAAVHVQRVYAHDKGIPWGISECAFSTKDDGGNYQYHAFGVPQLAIHKPDQDGPVVSPYSTFMALMVDSTAALRNLHKLERKHALGTYGFYEALDFHPARCRSRFHRFELVRCWMAHHQGMSLLSVANFLHEEVVQRWFHSHPRVQATELLLQEKPSGHVRSPRPRSNVA
jgi:cyclic beta-1,2-glucan synthetase